MYLQLMPTEVKQLHVAVMKNDSVTVSSLIEQGVDVNFPWVSEPNSCAVKHGISPLNEAVALNHTRIALMLIDAGADVNEVDSKGMSPLCRACHFGNEKLVKRLVERGARVNLSRKIEHSPLWFAILCLTQCKAGLLPQYESVIRTLLCAGAEVRVPNAVGKSPLHFVCQYMIAPVIPIFVDFGAVVDMADMHFHTPLFDCISYSGNTPFSKTVQRYRQFAVAEQLLKADCDDLDIAVWIERCSPNAVTQIAQSSDFTYLHSWCLENVNRPLKLKNLCRLKLHDHFGGVFQTSLCVSYLDIPLTLRLYLCRETFYHFQTT
ncbi:ankyrin repeat and SOCS box protein 13-like [Symsagittifera roscoffensis]|uniref:ankyrin repeat and SOCS box protein 13-like n=1 Tax=Symsagittifera roscoffensis TaxID=84072 RepID=UPI00307B3897